MNGPILKLVGRALLHEADLTKIQGSMVRSMINFNNYLERVPLSQEEMRQFLSFRLNTVRKAQKRSNWWGGRLPNFFTIGNLDYLQMSGARVGEVFSLAGYEVPDVLDALTEYHVRLDIVEDANANFNNYQIAKD